MIKFWIFISSVLAITLLVLCAKFFFLRVVPNSSRIKRVELPFRENIYTLNYQNNSPDSVENISLFNTSEIWYGSGFFNSALYYEYPVSLTLAGSNGQKISAFREVKLNLAKMSDFDLILNLRSDVSELEEASLIFLDDNSKSARFVIPIIRKGWDIIRFSKEQFNVQKQFNWTYITQVKFEFLSRPLGRVVVNLAGLRAQTERLQDNDWNIVDKNFLMLDKRDSQISLMVRNIGKEFTYATLKKITYADNFSFQVKLRPLTSGWRGIFFRGDYSTGLGYFLMVKGVGGNLWTIYKSNIKGKTDLNSSIIPNFQFEPDKWYFLKIVVTGQKFKAYLSTDGVKYRTLGEAEDNEFKSGGIGITVNNQEVSLFNEFIFTQFNN